jgi:citrate lyase subunit beta/citryl-CoA lyase
MEKALSAGADALILDLEDSVAPQRKAEARLHVGRFLNRQTRNITLFVRINPLNCDLADEDLAALADAAPDGLVLPKAEGAASIIDLERRLNAMRIPHCGILPIATESPAAIFRLGEFSTVTHRLIGLTWGAEDLPAAIGAVTARLPDGRFTHPYEMVQALALFAAHAAGVSAMRWSTRFFATSTVYLSTRIVDQAMGMMAIHPLQVPIINAAFTPSAEAVAHARRVIAAFRNAPGAGVSGWHYVRCATSQVGGARALERRGGRETMKR